ncbi:IclR family transcriptional regulator [Candidimonas humi]|uniref:IclR family transcriptional regulator n=1 Tax=Candidimonas humi TaxID=683355 RepID=A0ABV8NYL7_9BURK|nr:IclR family transcriptional regulator [Candidimonas humi]MBV6304541.1 IclR family transcriptional regulator [Candidimonas humi]
MSENPETEVVTAAVRALDILDVFTMEYPHLGLSEIARRAGLAKSTTQRLLKTLESRGYVVQNDSAQWRLGPATASLGGRYQIAFDIRENVEPALRKLSDTVGEDTSFFVRDGDRRIRLIKIQYPNARHSRARVGESMPLDRGAAGRVILAAMGQQGMLYDEIRARGYHVTVGEAKVASASIGVPVFGSRWKVIGALCIGAPAEDGVATRLTGFAPQLRRAAEALSAALSYDNDGASQRLIQARATWHP